MNKAQKATKVQELHDKFSRASAAVIVEYRGLNVANISDLRNQLREKNVELQVIKNTLALRSLDDTAFAPLNMYLEGPTAVAISYDDPVAPAKVLTEYVKKSEILKIKVGVVEGAAYNQQQLGELAKLPGRQELMGSFVGTLAAPLQNFVGGFNSMLSQFVQVLKAVEEKKSQE